MERFRKCQRGGGRQALYVPSSHALEALSFEAAFVWRLSIDSAGPITEGNWFFRGMRSAELYRLPDRYSTLF